MNAGGSRYASPAAAEAGLTGALRITVGFRNAPESWRDYLYWNVELEDT